MTISRWSRVVSLLTFFGLASLASGQTADSPDGLVKVTPRRMELAWLRPGADFRPYTKVIVDPTQVAFRPNWMKDYNLNAQLGNWVTQEDANKILAAAQTNFDEIFREAFRKAGYEVVTTPGHKTGEFGTSWTSMLPRRWARETPGRDVDHHCGSSRADRGSPRWSHQRVARPGRRQARHPGSGSAAGVVNNHPLRFPWSLLFDLWAGI